MGIIVLILIAAISLTCRIINLKIRSGKIINENDSTVEATDKNGIIWPSDLNLPKYNNGKIKTINKIEEQEAWTIIMENTNESYFQEYKQFLIQNGWLTDDEIKIESSMIQAEKDNYQINVIWDPVSQSVLLTLHQIN